MYGFPGGTCGKKDIRDTGSICVCQCRRYKRCRFDPWIRKIPWSRKWQPTLVFLPGKLHGQRSLLGYSPWGCKELDTTEQPSMQALTYNLDLKTRLTHICFRERKMRREYVSISSLSASHGKLCPPHRLLPQHAPPEPHPGKRRCPETQPSSLVDALPVWQDEWVFFSLWIVFSWHLLVTL